MQACQRWPRFTLCDSPHLPYTQSNKSACWSGHMDPSSNFQGVNFEGSGSVSLKVDNEYAFNLGRLCSIA